MEEKIQDLVKRVKAKTFHDDFDEQLDTVEELYGRQIRFHFDRAIVENHCRGTELFKRCKRTRL